MTSQDTIPYCKEYMHGSPPPAVWLHTNPIFAKEKAAMGRIEHGNNMTVKYEKYLGSHLLITKELHHIMAFAKQKLYI